ncbi:MAG: hypothetical protein ACOYOP_10890 [Microthrixaceae bacterium]
MTTDADGVPASDDHVVGGLLGLPVAVAGEVIAAVPRLLGRTRRQVELARRVAGNLPCAGFLAPRPAPASVPAHEVAPVDVLSVIADPTADEAGAADPNGPAPSEQSATQPDDAAPGDAAAPTAEELAVPDYDALSASQVVPRLASLNPEELAAVRAYERAHRNRQTILGRVAQLLDA